HYFRHVTRSRNNPPSVRCGQHSISSSARKSKKVGHSVLASQTTPRSPVFFSPRTVHAALSRKRTHTLVSLHLGI
ncbi:hypothetical protein PENTCL1PPCAC_8705, partial [Pristionchus entomophagus]